MDKVAIIAITLARIGIRVLINAVFPLNFEKRFFTPLSKASPIKFSGVNLWEIK